MSFKSWLSQWQSRRPRLSADQRQRTQRLRRALGLEQLETRSLLAMDLMAAQQLLAKDVNGDGSVAPIDALEVINYLNTGGSPAAPNTVSPVADAGQWARFDINGDHDVSPLDALLIVNDLNTRGAHSIEVADFGDDNLSHLNAAQQDYLQQVFSHANAARAHGNVNSLQIVKLVHDLTTALKEAQAPSAAAVAHLQTDIAQVSTDGQLSTDEIALITADLKTVLEEANVSADNIQAVVDDFQAIVGSGMEATQPLLSVLGKLAHECLHNPTPTPLPVRRSLARRT